jgi:CDP-glucose 4,6-dehydratase
MIVDKLLAGDPNVVGQAFNTGTSDAGLISVGTVATKVIDLWNSKGIPNAKMWETDPNDHPHEANMLRLDTAKIEQVVGYRSKLDVDKSLEFTVEWEKRVRSGDNALEVSYEQIEEFYR